MSVRFTLKDRNSKADTLIFATYAYEGKRLKLSTGEHANPKYWNFDKGICKEIQTQPINKQINARLVQLRNKIETAYLDLKLRNMPRHPAALKAYLKGETKLGHTLATYFDWYQQNEIEQRGFQRAKAYKTAYRYLMEFFNQHRYYGFDEIDEAFYKKYLHYLQSKGLANNYISTLVAKLKVVMKASRLAGYHSSTAYEQFKKPQEEGYNIYLNELEIFKIFKCLNINSLQKEIKDGFVVGCWTGLRHSDWGRIGLENVNFTNNTLRVKTQKTGEWVVIPLHKYVRNIIKRYNGFPKGKANQHLNREIKHIAKAAGIKGSIVLTRTQGGKKVSTTYQKWELVTTHTARRSFATNLYKAGIPAINIMKITGHRNVGTFMKYIKIDAEENAELLSKHKLFN